MGGKEEALTPEELDAVAENAIGAVPTSVPSGILRGDQGRAVTSWSPDTGSRQVTIELNQNLSSWAANQVLAHEIGHGLESIAGDIPTTGLSRDLGPLYNTMVTGEVRQRNLTRPQDLGYSDEEAPREQMAEAIRTHMTNPTYMKTVAPKTATAIREAINAHPVLSKAIQFDAIGLPIVMGA